MKMKDMIMPQKHRFTQNKKRVFSVKTSVPSVFLWLKNILNSVSFSTLSLINLSTTQP